MFPLLTERLGTAFDLVVEFSTLGAYGPGDSPAPASPSAPPAAVSHAPGLGGAGPCRVGRSRARCSIAGATAGCSPAAAARSGGVVSERAAAASEPLNRTRRPAPPVPAQPCRA